MNIQMSDMAPQRGQMMNDEAGELDNRLSLNPNDDRWKSTVGAWQDGEKYTVTLQVQQVSPGEFEVVSLQSQEAEEQAEPETDSGAPAAKAGPSYPNPAIQKELEAEG
jgi:hypothetical protein